MTWRQYARFWRLKHVGAIKWLTKQEAARYIAAVTKFAKADTANQLVLRLRVEFGNDANLER